MISTFSGNWTNTKYVWKYFSKFFKNYSINIPPSWTLLAPPPHPNPLALQHLFHGPTSHPISGNIERLLINFSLKNVFFCYKTLFLIYFHFCCQFCLKVQCIVLKKSILTGVIIHQFRKRRYRRLSKTPNVNKNEAKLNVPYMLIRSNLDDVKKFSKFWEKTMLSPIMG